ncbi:MAG: excinuclease ABC subunit C, partial [Candidatus Dadabacteria bacterium]|nr:excinuclease ABC subunit C [Candidatus Dadabacteria bacterium]NIT13753.1 excinuclease ABC subunit C [Candidatus Dadabacteria bacterium]
MTNINNQIENAPAKPGVYIMKNSNKRVLYVGKAKHLKKRVTSYFTPRSSDSRYQIYGLLKEIDSIEFIVTKNERDALILENSLIKKYKPRFNVQFKDDKTYFSLKLDINERYPRLYYTRRVADDGALYFGPFTSSTTLKKTKKFFHKMFPLRDCNNSKFKRHSERPCINYNMNLCSGPCANKISQNDYNLLTEQARLYLTGKFKEIIKLIKNNMKLAAKDLRFEEAAFYRNQLSFLNMHIDQKGLIDSKTKDIDALGIFSEDRSVSIVILYFRNGAVTDKSEYYFENSFGDDGQILEEFIYRYYSGSGNYPKEICVNTRLENTSFIKQWLNEKSGRVINVLHPSRGKK